MPGGRRDAKGRRAGKVWSELTRCHFRRYHGIGRARVECTNLTAEQQSEGCVRYCDIAGTYLGTVVENIFARFRSLPRTRTYGYFSLVKYSPPDVHTTV